MKCNGFMPDKRTVLEMVDVNEMQFSLMPGNGTVDALFMLRMMQEKYDRKRRSCISVLWIWRRRLIECQKR